MTQVKAVQEIDNRIVCNLKYDIESINSILDMSTLPERVIVYTKHVESIYNYALTSNINFEKFKICELNKGRKTDNASYEINRTLIRDKYFYVDNAFPFYRGLHCYREKYNGSRSVKKYVNQHEISLYKEFIKLIYYMESAISAYDIENIKTKYSDFELNILLPELLTSVVNDVITIEEENMLYSLMERDKVLSSFLRKLRISCSQRDSISIAPLFAGQDPAIMLNATVIDFLREVISMFFSGCLARILKQSKDSHFDINMRSFSDFRLIFELRKEYECLEFNIEFSNSINGNVVFNFVSEDSNKIVEKYFVREDVLDEFAG